MDNRILWKLSVLLATAVGHIAIRPCSPIPESFRLSFRAVVAPEQQSLIANDSRNLVYLMKHEPCLRVEYDGVQLTLASHIVIYGTCSYERMFRFRTVYANAYNCWQSTVAIWKPGSCESIFVTENYSLDSSEVMFFSPLKVSVALREASSELKVGLWTGEFDVDQNVTMFDGLLEGCVCNGTDESEDWSHNMADFWRKNCQSGDKSELGMVGIRIIVELVAVGVGIGLLGWCLRRVVASSMH